MSNYFELLGIHPAFNLDLKSVEAAYFKAQRQYHPDRFVGKSPEERAKAASISADINQAYNTLKNPLKRAQYLLSLQGIKVGTDADTIKPTQELLMEVMAWREEGAPANIAQIEQESIDSIASSYKNADWQAMSQETLRLGYIMKTHSA